MPQDNSKQFRLKRAAQYSTDSAMVGSLPCLVHILNNSIMPIKSRIEYLGDDEAAKFRHILDNIQNAVEICQRMSAMVQTESRNMETLNLSDEVSLAIDAWKPRIGSNIELKLALPTVPFRMIGNSLRLSQMMGLLLDNAFQAIGYTNGVISVSLKSDTENQKRLMLEADESALELCVTDSGIGMDERLVNSCCDPFFTTFDDRFGLGLCAVNEIAILHGGKIDIVSSKDQGTSVSIFLPCIGS